MLFRNSLFSLLVTGLGLAGCSTSNPLYCEVAADCTQPSANYCDIDGLLNPKGLTNTCVATPANNACNAVELGSCNDGEVCLPGTSADSPGTCVECLVDLDCGGDATCDQRTNRCEATPCTQGSGGDDFCMMADRDTPLCGPASVCVECIASNDCTRDQDNVHCDTVVGECGACIAHDECASGACAFDGERCVREDKITYVDGSIPVSGADCGTPRNNPCKTIAEGLAASGENTKTLVISAGDYSEHIAISTDTLVLIAEGEVTLNPTLALVAGRESVLEVTGNAQVSVYGLSFIPVNAVPLTDVITCTGANASLFFSGVAVQNSDGLGVSAVDCNITIHRSTIALNAGGGISINRSPYSLVNNFITENGNFAAIGSEFGGVSITNTDTVNEVFNFNTLAANGIDDSAAGGSAFTCSNSKLTAKGNILIEEVGGGGGSGITSLTAGCSFEHSIFGEAPPVGTGNISGLPTFEPGGYHLALGSQGIDIVDLDAPEVIDWDGDARPLGAGKDMGADEYVP